MTDSVQGRHVDPEGPSGYEEFPNPIDVIREWAVTNRPDIVKGIDEIDDNDEHGDPQARALMFLLSVGLAAGAALWRITFGRSYVTSFALPQTGGKRHHLTCRAISGAR